MSKSAYQIVGEFEADVKKGMISVTSPIARAIIGKRKGDSVEVSTPGGGKSYEILKVRLQVSRKSTQECLSAPHPKERQENLVRRRPLWQQKHASESRLRNLRIRKPQRSWIQAMGIEPQTVFVLQHGKGEYADEDLKFIGVFASREAANSAIRHLKTQRGFCTKEGRFSLDKYTVDQMHWSTGYISWAEASIR